MLMYEHVPQFNWSYDVVNPFILLCKILCLVTFCITNPTPSNVGIFVKVIGYVILADTVKLSA